MSSRSIRWKVGRRRALRARGSALLFLLPLGLAATGDAAAQDVATATLPATVEALSTVGPYEVATYTDFPDVPEFGAGTIYYPVNASGPVGGVAISPGFTELQRHIEWWGPRLASHGFAVLTLDTNEVRDSPELRAEALMAAVGVLRGENTRAGSPLQGRVDPEKMAVMGHSMGGGGALIAASQHGEELKASIPFTPWRPDTDFSATTVPTLVIAGSADTIAPVDTHSWPHFESIPSTTPKVYLEVREGSHFIADTTRGTDLDTIGRYAVAWLRLYMDGDESVRGLVYGPRPAGDSDKFSRYVENP
jgi:dienelactone hydrolase